MNFISIINTMTPLFSLFGKWLEHVVNSSDEEFKSISEAWPAPIKSELARIRAEEKARSVLGDDNG